ncbi:sodium:proton exchanger [archaeon]|nr:sodium:proton exchanger [archaeon]|tara:strand:+ start:4541 stop:6229 length:1689 start_codon:yes stop_codon:yes gene_type:complete
MAEFFLGLAVIIIACVVLGLVARLVKQPLIIAYIIAGILLGPLVFNIITSAEKFSVFAEIGIAFLLFIVGLNMNFKSLRDVGKISLITGFGQIIFTSLIGFLIGKLVGLTNIEAIYVSVALTFSSTIIIIKLLSDKGDLETLYGKISIGILLVQDFVAIFALVLVTGISGGDNGSLSIFLLKTFLKAVILFLGAVFLYETVVPRLFYRISKNHELLFMGAIAWCFGVSAFAIYLGFGIEIGAFLAGITLAALPYAHEISSRIRPLRDFFIAIFFANLGLSIVSLDASSVIIPAIIFSLFVLIGNPLIVLILMGIFGHKKRTGFLVGLTVAQISEFSLILIALGIKFGQLDDRIVSLVTIVGIVTILTSTYMITHSKQIYNRFSKYLDFFQKRNIKEKFVVVDNHDKRYDIIICGAHRMGHGIVKSLKELKKKSFLVVDFNPDVIERLKKEKVKHLFGDISDVEVIDRLVEYKPKIVVSTIPDYDDNILLINEFKEDSKEVFVFVTAKNLHDAVDLYKKGADIVLFPEILAGQKIIDYLKHADIKDMRKWGDIYKRKLLEYHF